MVEFVNVVTCLKSAHGFRLESTPPKISPNGAPPGAKVETKNHHKTMKIKAPEAQILRTPVKIEKLSLWNRSRIGFIMNLEFHGFLDVSTPSVEIYFFSFLVMTVCKGVVPTLKNRILEVLF